jgi:hypothetical protein
MIFSDQPELDLDYMFVPTEDRLPPYFIELMEFRLASKFAIPVTGNRSLADTYFSMFTDQLNRAQFLDSNGRPGDGIVDNPIIESRF